jgi:hypothetical protein
MHKRQGDQSYPDSAVSIAVILAKMERFEGVWEVVKGDVKEKGAALLPL